MEELHDHELIWKHMGVNSANVGVPKVLVEDILGFKLLDSKLVFNLHFLEAVKPSYVDQHIWIVNWALILEVLFDDYLRYRHLRAVDKWRETWVRCRSCNFTYSLPVSFEVQTTNLLGSGPNDDSELINHLIDRAFVRHIMQRFNLVIHPSSSQVEQLTRRCADETLQTCRDTLVVNDDNTL